MTKKIVFFNCFHNGDVHVSRSFVREIINKVKQIDSEYSFSYTHKNNSSLIADIDNLTFNAGAMSGVSDEHNNNFMHNDNLYINTWYGQQQFKYMNRYGISMDSLYAALDDTCKNIWGFSLSDISEDPAVFFPIINYDKYNIQNIKIWLSLNKYKKKIFVSNGLALSGQAHNFAMTPIIINLANKHMDKIFILTNQEGQYILPQNVVYSSNIIRNNGFDLNENAFISENCDLIIGRASGAFAFAETYNNFLNRSCNILCFSNLVPPINGKFWLNDLLRDKINYSANITVNNDYDANIITNLINSYL
jgi:hypothetical protein